MPKECHRINKAIYFVGSKFSINPVDIFDSSIEYAGVIDIVIKANKVIIEQVRCKAIRE